MIREGIRCVAVAVALAGAAPAQVFRAPGPVEGAAAGAVDLDLMVDRAAQAAVAYRAGGAIHFLRVYGIPPSAIPVAAGARPILASLSPLQAAVVYAAPIAPGREAIAFALGGAGAFGAPQRLSDAAVEGQRPAVAVDPSGGLWIAWAQIDVGEPVVRVRAPGGAVRGIARGGRPALAADREGRVLAAYVRGDALRARRLDGLEFGEEATLAAGLDAFALAPDPAGGWVMAAARGGRIEVMGVDPAGTIAGPPVEVGEGRDPAVALGPGGRGAAAWVREDGIRLVRLAGRVPAGDPIWIATGVGDPHDPCVAVDPDGAVLVVFGGAGEAFWTSDAPPLAAAFEAEPRAGEAPLAVRFEDRTEGTVRARRWTFGDGGASAAAAPVHTFEDEGAWSVRLAVAGPGGRSEALEPAAVRVDRAANALYFEPASCPAGARSRTLPLYARHPDPLQALQIALAYPSAALQIEDLRIEGTALEPLAPEFVTILRGEEGDEATLVAAIVIDWRPPYDGRMLGPGEDQIVANFLYGVPGDVPPGTEIAVDLRDEIGDPPVSNAFTREGAESVVPHLRDGRILVSEPAPERFLRGDANGDGRTDIADPIFLLAYIFQDGPAPACPDAGDANDSGDLNIADPIWILNYFFADGAGLPPPFPEPGADPTDDGLPPCRGSRPL